MNIPFSGGFGKLDTIPGNKPVIVFCRVGDWSEQVAEILADRGYTVSTLDGGYQAYRALTLKKDTGKPEKADPKREKAYIDAKGLKCPGPIVKVADFLRDKPAGTEVRVEATLSGGSISCGVRLVACQMSMDIMGIHKEELIDGVELGGVSTFLGSGEQSDMSLFI